MLRTNIQQAQVSGSLSYSDSVSRELLFKPNRTLADDFDALRTQVKGILGEETWMSSQAITLNNVKAQLTGTLNANNVVAAGTLDVTGVSNVSVLTSSAGLKVSAGGLDVTGASVLKSGLTVTGVMSGSGNLLVGGSATIAGSALVNTLTASNGMRIDAGGLTIAGDRLAIDGTLGVTGTADLGSLYTSGLAGISGSLTVAGATTLKSGLNVTGAMSGSGALQAGGALTVAGASALNSTLAVAGLATLNNGLTVNTAVADFNAGITTDSIKIDTDSPQRLYIVGPAGEIKDEPNMIFDGSSLKVTGEVSGSTALQSGGTLTVAGASTLNNTLVVAGATTVNGILDVNNTVSASVVKIDNHTPQRLYIVGSEGEIKDEVKLTFDNSTFKVNAAMSGSGALQVGGAFDVAGITHHNADLYVSGTSYMTGTLDVSGTAIFRNGFEIYGDRLEITGSFAVSGSSTFDGTLAVSGLMDLNGGLSSSFIKIDNDAPQHLYIVGDDGSIFDEPDLTYNGSKLSVAGEVTVAQNFDVATNKFTVVAASGNTAVAGTLDAAGNFAVASNKFTVAATSGNTAVAGTLASAGDLAVATNKFTVAAASGNTAVAGTLAVAGKASLSGDIDLGDASADLIDFKGKVKSSVLVNSDAAYDLGSASARWNNAYIKSGSLDYLSVSGDAQINGDLRVKGSMTYIDTANMRVQDAFIYLATGSLGSTDSGIVLHGGAGANMDLAIAQLGGAGEFIFGKGNRPDGEGSVAGMDLVPLKMKELKLGSAENALSGSVSISGNNIKLAASQAALVFEDSYKAGSIYNTDLKLAASQAEWDSFATQFPSKSLLGAIASGSGIGVSFRKGVVTVAAANQTLIQFPHPSGDIQWALRSQADFVYGLDVYLNGALALPNDDYSLVSNGSGGYHLDRIEFNYGLEVGDRVSLILRNAALS